MTSPQEFERKLTAILSADVADYSRLMGEDEDSTIRTLTGHREMMATLIREHKGRVVDSSGDNLLAEFSSITRAVDCAVEIQREMAERNEELSDDRKMEYCGSGRSFIIQYLFSIVLLNSVPLHS